MTEGTIHTTVKPLITALMKVLMQHYWGPLYKHVLAHSDLIKTVPGFLLKREKIIVYVGRTHIAVEYTDVECIEELKSEGEIQIKYHDCLEEDCNFLEQIIGFDYGPATGPSVPFPSSSESLLLPTRKGRDKLSALGWPLPAEKDLLGPDSARPELVPGRFTRIVNGMFFDADASGLKCRRIKWLDCFPVVFDGMEGKLDDLAFDVAKMKDMVKADANYAYPMPDGYQAVQLPKINELIGKWEDKGRAESDIMAYLSNPEHASILTAGFGTSHVHFDLACEWQDGSGQAIHPGIFVVQPDGHVNIVEFKLPDLSASMDAGASRRDAFATWLNAYVDETDAYSRYFDEPADGEWFAEKYGFKVDKPGRRVVVGRRYDFDLDVWRELKRKFKDIDIWTFDDFLEGVIVPFYK